MGGSSLNAARNSSLSQAWIRGGGAEGEKVLEVGRNGRIRMMSLRKERDGKGKKGKRR